MEKKSYFRHCSRFPLWAMVDQLVPLRPMEKNTPDKISTWQPAEDPRLEQVAVP